MIVIGQFCGRCKNPNKKPQKKNTPNKTPPNKTPPNMPKMSKSTKSTKSTKDPTEFIYKGKKRYNWCYLCSKYISRNSHKRHVQRKHVVKTLQCRHCSKKCACQADLNSHMLVHSSVHRFKCLHCDQTFKWQSHRSKHVKNAHPGVERPVAFLPLKWNPEDFVHGPPSLRETSSVVYATDKHRTPSGVVRAQKSGWV